MTLYKKFGNIAISFAVSVVFAAAFYILAYNIHSLLPIYQHTPDDREMWVQRELNVLLKPQGGSAMDPGVTSSSSQIKTVPCTLL